MGLHWPELSVYLIVVLRWASLTCSCFYVGSIQSFTGKYIVSCGFLIFIYLRGRESSHSVVNSTNASRELGQSQADERSRELSPGPPLGGRESNDLSHCPLPASLHCRTRASGWRWALNQAPQCHGGAFTVLHCALFNMCSLLG